MRGTPWRRTLVKGLALAALGAGLVWGVSLPMSTHQGVNFRVSTQQIPFYVKALDFLHRHYQYEGLARDITWGLTSDLERVQAVFQWTRTHIQPTPPGWTVVDDHILNIIIRGHGLSDQMADVFATLSTYAGVPAFWRDIRSPDLSSVLILSFAKINGQWAVLDVARGIIFTDAQGRWVGVDQLLQDPALLREVMKEEVQDGIPYWRYLEVLRPFHVPEPLRARAQMPWPRLWSAVRLALGVEHR